MANTPDARLTDRLFAGLLWLLPTRALSRLAHSLAESRVVWLKNRLIDLFLRLYPQIRMGEAAEPDPRAYPTFNAFFTRPLAAGMRHLPADPGRIVCPVDGTVGAFGDIKNGQVCQTKGMHYSLAALLGDPALAARFDHGRYMTLYLAPHNYHRVHMPMDGVLAGTDYRPGRLFGVNPRCVRAIPRLFTRNERLTALFETALGPVAVVMVGAFIVGGIHTRWAGRICPPHVRASRSELRPGKGDAPRGFDRGDEIGHFSVGSSVILLFPRGTVNWERSLAPGDSVKLGHPIADIDPVDP